MPMLKADNLISNNIRAVLPASYNNAPYVKFDSIARENAIVTIKEVVYSTYEVMEKDDNGKVVYVDGIAKPRMNAKGEPILNTTAYLLFDDGRMSSVKTRTAVNQLYTLTGEPAHEVGTFHYDKDVDGSAISCPVRIVPCKDKYGSVERDTWAFDPQ